MCLESHDGKKLGAEEDGFALEHFDGEEEGGGGVDAGGGKDDGDEVPVIGAGDEFLAKQADVQDRDEGELWGELDPGEHGGDGRYDNDKRHGREIALGLFVGLGEERDGHKGSGEKDGNGEGHEEDRYNCLGAELEEKTRGSRAPARSLASVVT